MNEAGDFFETAESDAVDALRAQAARIVRRSAEGEFELVRTAGWIAVPVEGSSHLSGADAQRLESAFGGNGHSKVYAVALEALRGVVPVYVFGSSVSGFRRFNRECAHFNYALFSEDFSVLVLCTTDDYFVAVGHPEFVREAIGKSESEAMDAFRVYASDPGWTEKMRAMLRSVLDALNNRYSNVPAGGVVQFPG